MSTRILVYRYGTCTILYRIYSTVPYVYEYICIHRHKRHLPETLSKSVCCDGGGGGGGGVSAFKNTTSSSLACVCVCVALLSGAFKSSQKCPTERLSVCIFFSRVIHVTAAAVIRIRIEQCVIRMRGEGVKVIDLIKKKVVSPQLFYSKYCILYGSKI